MRAAGGTGILAAGENGAIVVAGSVRNPAKIDLHGYRADFYVEAVVSGDVGIGDTVVIAWEELAKERTVRFEHDQGALLALAPLPTQSIWRNRFKKSDGVVRIVASEGNAFLREPAAGTVATLTHYFAMARSAREAAPGLVRLVDLVAEAETPVAREALDLLTERQQHLGDTTEGARWALARSVADERRDLDLRRDTLAFLAAVRANGVRDLVEKLTEVEGPLQGDAWRALDALDGGLSGERIDTLLASTSPPLRAVGASLARSEARAKLAAIVAKDPDPTVRASAVERLVALFQEDAFEEVAPALRAEDKDLGIAAARAVGRIGEAVIPKLVAMADEDPAPGHERAVLALSLTGPKGRSALKELYLGHKDEKVRNLAGLALGQLPGHKH